MRHLRVHLDDRRHDGNVVDHCRCKSDKHVSCGRSELPVAHVRQHVEIADRRETAHAQDDAVEEEEGVPLGAGDMLEQHRTASRRRFHSRHDRARPGSLQPVGQGLEIAEAEHHAESRGQSEERLKAHRGSERECEHDHDRGAAVLHAIPLAGRHFGTAVGQGKVHASRGHEIGDDGRQEQMKEVEEIEQPGLPYHQRGDVTEGAPCAAGIRGDHDIDAGQRDETRVRGRWPGSPRT